MAKEDILLRSVSNPPLTTKGSQLTSVELDGNWIEIYNALKELSQSSWIDAYDNAATYYMDDYVMYNSQLWKCVTASISAVTPGTDATKWQEKYASDLVDKPRQYKEYSAILTQTGTSAPVATVLQNDLSGTISFSYDAVGEYNVSSSALFTSAKTIIDFNINVLDINDEVVSRRRITDDSNIYLSVLDTAFIETNGWSGDITIKVYN